LEQSVRDQAVRDQATIGKPAHEKKAYRAYHAFRALLFGNWEPTALVQSRDKSETLSGT
jgi:hypothetical protein